MFQPQPVLTTGYVYALNNSVRIPPVSCHTSPQLVYFSHRFYIFLNPRLIPGSFIVSEILNQVFIKDDVNRKQVLFIGLVFFPFFLTQQINNSISEQEFVFFQL